MDIPVYNAAGGDMGTITYETDLTDQLVNHDLLYRVVNALQSNQHQPVADTKDRRERRGGGTKPWRQKGTGRARHGSIRSPLWKGGGVTFGPRKEKSHKKKINKKERRKATACALSAKHQDGELVGISDLNLDSPSTARVAEILEEIGSEDGLDGVLDGVSQRRNNRALFIMAEDNPNLRRSLQNFSNIEVTKAHSVNALDLLTFKYGVLVDPETVIAALETRLTPEHVTA
jgi:large subunit ribosomal protein L4